MEGRILFMKPVFFLGKMILLIHQYISTMLLNYTFILDFTKYESKKFAINLASLAGNHWATSGLRVNSSLLKGGLIIFPLFLIDGNTILPMTAKADCVTFFTHFRILVFPKRKIIFIHFFINEQHEQYIK